MADNGWVRVDCHLHTAVSGDAVTSIDELAERVEQEGLDVVCITDHNVTTGALAAIERGIGARVIIGEEIRTSKGDIIGLFLSERIPYVLPLPEVTSRIRDQGGLIYIPHPFDTGRTSLGAVAEQLCAEGLVDAIEVFNAKIEDDTLNQKAADLAARFGLPGGAGSDAHDPDGIGAACIEIPDFDSPADFLAALAVGRVSGEHRPHAIRYARRPMA